MKEYLAELIRDRDPSAGRNVAREYLQARILSGMQRAGAMIPLSFHGGTALRFLYGVPRYSEDLDFALERPEPGYNLKSQRTPEFFTAFSLWSSCRFWNRWTVAYRCSILGNFILHYVTAPANGVAQSLQLPLTSANGPSYLSCI